MAGGPPPEPGADIIQFADYVASLAAELSKLARNHRLMTLAYLLEVTRLEARGVSQGNDILPPRVR